MRLLAAIAFLAWSAFLPAFGQGTDSPVMGSSATEEQIPLENPDELTRVLVLGDAVGGGLGAGLARVGEATGRYEVAIRFNEESGLARPEVYDWAETLPKILESNSYDVIVVLIGSNDRQMIRSGNERLVFNSPVWVEAYKAQVDRLLDELIDSGAKVYWVSIPPMADAGYDAAMRSITDIQRQRVVARGVAFLDIRAQFSAADGSYTEFGPDDTGEIRKLRASDGVSFFKQGNNRLGQLVLQAIESGATETPKTARLEVPEVTRPVPTEKPGAVPVFGQKLMLGEDYTIEPQDVTVGAAVLAGEGVPPSAALQAIRAMAPSGSAAERLFRMGEAVPGPKGRADDFSVAPAASN
jgi:uncharacterized protein